jgi:hypothetical protein
MRSAELTDHDFEANTCIVELEEPHNIIFLPNTHGNPPPPPFETAVHDNITQTLSTRADSLTMTGHVYMDTHA